MADLRRRRDGYRGQQHSEFAPKRENLAAALAQGLNNHAHSLGRDLLRRPIACKPQPFWCYFDERTPRFLPPLSERSPWHGARHRALCAVHLAPVDRQRFFINQYVAEFSEQSHRVVE